MLYGGLAVVVALLGAFVLRARRTSTRETEAVRGAVAGIRLEDVPALAAECERAVRDQFRTELAWDDVDGSLRRIDALLREREGLNTRGFRNAFSAPGHPHRYVAVVGSLAGELLVSAGEAVWTGGPDAPLLRRHDAPGRTISPFAEVIRTVQHPQVTPLSVRLRSSASRPRAAAVS